MNVLALDWNATRVRAVLGDDDPLAVPLDPPGLDLPLAIAVDERTIGAAALRKCRTAEHQICQSFLPYLTDRPNQGPRWQSLSAHGATEMVWRQLFSLASSAKAIVVTLPDYFRPIQAQALLAIGQKLRLPVTGSMPIGLAGALAGLHAKRWQRSALVIDVDAHALTMSWVKSLADHVHLVDHLDLPHLGFAVWQQRLIDALADRFIHEHRRDPRDIPQAEQCLFDQLDLLTDATVSQRSLQIGVQGRAWYKHVLVQPEATVAFCRDLAAKVRLEAEHLLRAWPSAEWPPVVLLTDAAGRLPGLANALRSLPLAHPASETKMPQLKATEYDEDDLGENLLIDDEPTIDVHVLAPEAPAQAVHRLADMIIGHVESNAPFSRDAQRSAEPPQRAPLRIAAKRIPG